MKVSITGPQTLVLSVILLIREIGTVEEVPDGIDNTSNVKRSADACQLLAIRYFAGNQEQCSRV